MDVQTPAGAPEESREFPELPPLLRLAALPALLPARFPRAKNGMNILY